MNDEELRAFLDSATVGDDNGGEDQGDATPDLEAADDSNTPATDDAPRRAVPSFDELMNMPTPDAVAAPAQRVPEVAPEQPKATNPAAPISPVEAAIRPVKAPSAPTETASPKVNEWSQTYAQDEEQLVPLILPGFSSEPRPRRDLPPVFQAEPVTPQQAVAPHVDPAPTQPFDVLNNQAAVPEVVTARSEAPAAAIPAAAAAAAAATASLASASIASARPAAAVSATKTPAANVSQPVDDPFALLAPDLADAESSDDEYERISVTGGAARGRKALPWLIVGGGVVIAIIASIFVINGVRSDDAQAPTDKPAVTSEPAPEETTPPAPEPEPSEEPAPEPNTAPVIDPGSTYTFPISQWGLTFEASEKLGGSTPYTLFDGNSRAMFDTIPVAAGLSEACAAARAEHVWGLLKKDDGTIEVIRPEPRCTVPGDAAIYDTIWGVLDHMAKSAKPV